MLDLVARSEAAGRGKCSQQLAVTGGSAGLKRFTTPRVRSTWGFRGQPACVNRSNTCRPEVEGAVGRSRQPACCRTSYQALQASASPTRSDSIKITPSVMNTRN